MGNIKVRYKKQGVLNYEDGMYLFQHVYNLMDQYDNIEIEFNNIQTSVLFLSALFTSLWNSLWNSFGIDVVMDCIIVKDLQVLRKVEYIGSIYLKSAT